MTKEEIGSILKQLRIASGKTQKEVAEMLGRKQQIVGHWETGYSQPDANTLFMLCDIYGTTVDDAFGFKKSRLSPIEKSIIEKYNSLDAHGKDMVDTVLEKEYARCTSDQPNKIKPLVKPELLAAHHRTDVEYSEDEANEDINMMSDENF